MGNNNNNNNNNNGNTNENTKKYDLRRGGPGVGAGANPLLVNQTPQPPQATTSTRQANPDPFENSGVVIAGRWRVGRKLGSGAFGSIYEGTGDVSF